MKILRRGNLPENSIYRGTCNHCKTEFECAQHEGKLVLRPSTSFLEVSCPVCQTKAIAYKLADPGGALVPDIEKYRWREESSWFNMAAQIAAVEEGRIVER